MQDTRRWIERRKLSPLVIPHVTTIRFIPSLSAYVLVQNLNSFCLYLCVCVCACALSCLTLCNPADCSPPGSSSHGISHARILEWVAISCSRGSSWPGDPSSLLSPHWQVHSFPPCHLGSPDLYLPTHPGHLMLGERVGFWNVTLSPL